MENFDKFTSTSDERQLNGNKELLRSEEQLAVAQFDVNDDLESFDRHAQIYQDWLDGVPGAKLDDLVGEDLKSSTLPDTGNNDPASRRKKYFGTKNDDLWAEYFKLKGTIKFKRESAKVQVKNGSEVGTKMDLSLLQQRQDELLQAINQSDPHFKFSRPKRKPRSILCKYDQNSGLSGKTPENNLRRPPAHLINSGFNEGSLGVSKEYQPLHIKTVSRNTDVGDYANVMVDNARKRIGA